MNKPNNWSENQPGNELTKIFFQWLLDASVNDTDRFIELRGMMQLFCEWVKIDRNKIIKHEDYKKFIQTYQTPLQGMMWSLRNITTVTTKDTNEVNDVISDPKKVGKKIQEYKNYLNHITMYYEELQELLDTQNIQSSLDNDIIVFKKLLALWLGLLEDEHKIEGELVRIINRHPIKEPIVKEITEMEEYLEDEKKRKKVVSIFNFIAKHWGYWYIKGPSLWEVVGREQVKTMIKKIYLLIKIDMKEIVNFIHTMTNDFKKEGMHTDTDLFDTTKNYYMSLILDNTDKSLSLYIFYNDGTQWLSPRICDISKKMNDIYLLIHKLWDIKDDTIITCIEAPSDEDIYEQQTQDEEREIDGEESDDEKNDDDDWSVCLRNNGIERYSDDDDDFQNLLSSLSRMYKEYVLIPIILKEEKWTQNISSYKLNNLLDEIFDESSFEKDKEVFLDKLLSYEKKNNKKGTYTITFYLSSEGQLAIKLSNDDYDSGITPFWLQNEDTINNSIVKKFLEKRWLFANSLKETLDYDERVSMENEEEDEDDESCV